MAVETDISSWCQTAHHNLIFPVVEAAHGHKAIATFEALDVLNINFFVVYYHIIREVRKPKVQINWE